MISKVRVWRLALGWSLASTLALASLLPASPALAETSARADSSAPVLSAGSVRSADIFGGFFEAKKKKKRYRAKIANPDTLPQPLVQVIPGSAINLLSRSSEMPIAIKNSYDSEVRVRVRVQPSNLKVLFPTVVEVKVPANTTVTAKVPVNAIADGPVVLHATLESFSGIRLTVPVDIQMYVILGLEDTVIFGFLGFVALLSAFGVFRTIRKRRREILGRGGK